MAQVRTGYVARARYRIRYARKYAAFYLFLLLPITYLLIFEYWPMLGAQIAFRKFTPAGGIWHSPWVGLAHITKFIRSYQFDRVVVNTLRISVYSIVAGFPIPILLALMLNCLESVRFKKIVQNLLYIPHFISTVVIVGILLQVLNPVVGLYGQMIHRLTGSFPKDPLSIPSVFPHLYVWSGVWQSMGWGTVIYVAALSAVDASQHEAAMIDGASRLQRVLHVDFPAILPTIMVLLILRFGSIMGVGFEKVYLMQNALNLRMSEVISTYVYKVGLASGGGSNFSYATAIGMFNSVINLILLMMVNAVSRRISETSLW